MHVKTEALLSELDGLGHSPRLGRTVARVRAAERPQVILDDLERAGGAYCGLLCVAGAQAVGDGARLLRLLRSPSVGVRRAAACEVARRVSDPEAVVAVTLAAEPMTRQALVRAVYRRRRVDVAERLFPTLWADRQERLAIQLLTVCSADTIREALSALDDGRVPWRRLAIYHPELTEQRLRQALERRPLPRRRHVWAQARAAVERLARVRPGPLLDLLEELGPADEVPSGVERTLGDLLRAEPERTAALLLHPERRPWLVRGGLPSSVLQRLRHLEVRSLPAVARALATAPMHLAAMLDALDPSLRPALFEHAYAETETATRVWPDELLRVLPHATRHREAARMLGLRAVASARERTLAVRAFGAIADARVPFEEAARAAKAEDRALAVELLIACSALERRQVTETLRFLLRFKNDQDPVRIALFSALADVPGPRFSEEDADLLSTLVDHAMEARDTSWGTRRARGAAPDAGRSGGAGGAARRLRGSQDASGGGGGADRAGPPVRVVRGASCHPDAASQ